MPARLVYAPKAYVFTKNASGAILNLTDYVTSGQVQRLISQPSTASVTLRNPQKRFTIPKSPVFHPMDPITIFLERLKGYPVQVFTGYLDDTPYYQMYPGVITLTATCTLKRLLYTYWDPSLPYVNAFLNKFGWINDNGNLRNITALANQGTVAKGQTNALQDGSIGKLLWAVLTDIGDWRDTNIWIEQLPSGPNGIAARMAKLMATLATDEANAAQEFEAFMNAVIGSSSQGSGGTGAVTGSGGGVVKSSVLTSGQQVFASNVSQSTGLDPNVVAAWVLAEESGSAAQSRQSQSNNDWLNIGYTDSATFGSADSIWSDPVSAANATVGWLGGQNTVPGYGTASQGIQGILKSAGESPQRQIQTIQQSGWASSGYPALAQDYQTIINSPGAASSPAAGSGAGAANLTNSNNPRGTAIVNNTQGVSSGGGTLTDYYTSPFPGGPSGATIVANQRTDMGVDWDLGPIGSHIVAIGNAQILGTQEPGWPGPGSPNNFMWYQLLDGPNQGAIIYHAEGIHPIVSANTKVAKGTPIATVADQSSGVEFGYCDANGTTLGSGEWHSDPQPDAQRPPTDAGKRFARFIRALGAQTRDDPGQGPYAPSGATAIVGGSQPGSAGAGGGTGSAASDLLSQANAEAFTAELNFPSLQDMTTAMLLGNAHKGLMHDQQLLPFIQQLSQASLRSFMSLPNGDFYAFYPDYFGETNHRKPYWNIADIEVLDGGINLSDSSLVTHQYAVGDNTYPVDNALINMLFSAGSITVFNAFLSPNAVGIDTQTKLTGGMADIMSQAEAVEFIKRYGARPQVSDYPMVRSALYEMFLAYQQFMLAWSNQFSTPFGFTFMPEIFPGGKVAFPQHGLQMYVNSVTHTWDYAEAGFATTAVLSAPAVMPGSTNPDLPPDMVQALVEPIRQAALTDPQTGQPKQKSAQTSAQEITGATKQVAQTVAKNVETVVKAIEGVF